MRTARRLPWPPLALAAACGLLLAAGPADAPPRAGWKPFGFLTDPLYGPLDKGGLLACLGVAVAGLGYAFWLMRAVTTADDGTPAMREVAKAVRDGANAYLRRQLSVVGVLVVIITAALVLVKWPWGDAAGQPGADEAKVVAVGRGAAFLMGATFSALVGFTGMRLATAGNLRVAAAARRGFGDALRIAYRTGTVTGMFTCGLGLLGGTLILLVFGETAYQVLLGFGFGGSLLALFMRVGGGIYTKAADVGADLVGKVEKDIAEDDPRNAATIADNVGDNVGDCAGMAADVFESYAVTMVAAVILGYASLGVKGMIFPLLVMAVGVVSSMISTALVGRGVTTGTATTAMRSINRGFWRSAAISVVGFLTVGAVYLQFDPAYVVGVAIERGMYRDNGLTTMLSLPAFDSMDTAVKLQSLRKAGEGASEDAIGLNQQLERRRQEVMTKWQEIGPDQRAALADKSWNDGMAHNWQHPDPLLPPHTSDTPRRTVLSVAQAYAPLRSYRSSALAYTPRPDDLELSAAWCCLIGIVLAIALNFCTEYWTSTDYGPVKGVVKACRTGHATNIIAGLALGYESAVWAALLIAAGVLGSAAVFAHTHHPLFIAFGVAMTGVGMLTLTGDTISMDVFGPVADNANGIGEMGFDKNDPATEPARKVLCDLDAVGNTTKAITKGIAIGSAVIAAVSLFASFIAVLVTGAEEKIGQLTLADFADGAAKLTVADPRVLVGMLVGGAVPLLFSAMTIRAVGRAAYLIVFECRNQFRDPDVWAGKKTPDYGRVVDICTATAQRELIGPGLLAIGTPLVVGFLLGPFALGGFLAGTIVVGQLLAVFMSNAGGAWDNAKKMVEDEPRDAAENTGKGSEKHKAAVTGDTVGDPLKDTAGPAINPLIKVMNMVSLLALPLVLTHNVSDGPGDRWVGAAVAAVAGLAVAWAWWTSKHESAAVRQMEAAMNKPS